MGVELCFVAETRIVASVERSKVTSAGQSPLALALAFVLTACAPGLVNQQTEEQSVRAASNDFQHAIAARDSDRIVKIFGPEPVLIVAHTPAATGSPAVRQRMSGFLALPTLSLTWVPIRIEVLGPTGAIEYGTYTLAYDTPQGRANDAGNYLNIWQKVGGQWRLGVHAIVTSRPPP